jgi:predicted N-acyltransferase
MLVRPGVDPDAARKLLLGAAMTLCDRHGASSLHINFPMEDEWRWIGEQGLALRQGQQYQWFNQGYASFEDFLGALSSGRRKTIRRERRDAQAGLEIHLLTGGDIAEAHWDAFHQFYMDTGSRKWGRPYLNRRFFSLLSERMAERVLLIMARRDDRWIAGALNLIGDDCLFGRNWCYYQAIEWAIEHGLARVEAGAQGQHKIARGYLPCPVYSAHFIADPALRKPVERFVEQERAAVDQEMEWLSEAYSPFKET